MNKMNIVVVDGFVANSGDLSWDAIAALGNLTVYDRTDHSEIIERCNNADIVLTNKVVFDAGIIDALPRLRYIGVLATGYNNVDIKAASQHNITVTNIPAYSTDSVAQLVFALLLELTNRVAEYSQSVNAGDWTHCKDFSYRLAPIFELSGSTFGIMGFGNIGLKVARIAREFGMTVIANTSKRADEIPQWVEIVSLDDLFSRSDVLSINSALTPTRQGVINKDNLAKMKSAAYLINTARGGFIDENALADALRDHTIAGAALDVLNEEPPRNGSPLIGAPNCIITPHIAWQSTQARKRLLDIATENIKAFIAGTPQNVVS